MSHKKTYIESHWLVYALQGVIALLFGWFIMFTGISDLKVLSTLIASVMLILGVIEIFNIIHRAKNDGCILLAAIMAIIQVGIAVALFVLSDANMAIKVSIVAGYTLGRGLLEIMLAFHSISDMTDRFMWAVCGICGSVIAFVIFNSGNFADITTFIKFFGTYMMIYGVTNLFYSVHNKNELTEQKELKEALRIAKEKRAKRVRSRKNITVKKKDNK